MGCSCDMVKYIKKQRNIYYINSTLQTRIAGVGTKWTIGFPSMPQNIKANNCLISIDKMTLTDYHDIVNKFFFPLLVQTNIPSANCLSGNINGVGVGSSEMPSTTGFAELIPLQPTMQVQGTNGVTVNEQPILASYVSDNCERKVMCANPFGQTFSLEIYNVRLDGGRSKDGLAPNPNPNPLFTQGTINITFRIELLEEET